ncbi:MAG: hypothetical protein J6R37_00145 [Clostridia bacterium]|nr:hypothetical protein [Clostridia bacterium]
MFKIGIRKVKRLLSKVLLVFCAFLFIFCFSYKRSPKEIDCPKEYWFLQQGVLTCTTTPPQEHLVGTTYFLEGKTVEDICKLFSAKVVYCDQYGYYCYSYKLQKKVEVCGKVVNLQISADGTKVGFPLIVGSY